MCRRSTASGEAPTPRWMVRMPCSCIASPVPASRDRRGRIPSRCSESSPVMLIATDPHPCPPFVRTSSQPLARARSRTRRGTVERRAQRSIPRRQWLAQPRAGLQNRDIRGRTTRRVIAGSRCPSRWRWQGREFQRLWLMRISSTTDIVRSRPSLEQEHLAGCSAPARERTDVHVVGDENDDLFRREAEQELPQLGGLPVGTGRVAEERVECG